MRPSLQETLHALNSPGDPIRETLRGFSDLDSPGTETVSQAWHALPVSRRREAIQLCGDLAREHIELNFDRLCLIAIQDSDPIVRRTAIANLWEGEGPAILRTLLESLERDPDESVRAESARALGRFVYQCEVDGLHAALKHRLEEALLEAARGDTVDLRLQALEALGYSSRAEVLVLISETYRQDDPQARLSAVVAMGRSGDPRWKDLVMAELRNPSPAVRREAAHAAGELELRTGVSELIELLEDTNLEVQFQAIWALGQIGGKSAQRALERFLKGLDEPGLAAATEEALEFLAFVETTRDLEAGLRAQEDPR